jgi:hypothetical protein
MIGFPHPFKMQVSVKDNKVEVTFNRGYVNWVEPKIDGAPMGGRDPADGGSRGMPPILKGDLKYDKYNRCYICLKVKVDDDGTMPEDPDEDYLSIVISNGTRKGHNLGGQYWLHPLGVIAKGDPPVFCQHVYFNLLHWVGLNTKDAFYSDAPAGLSKAYHHYFSSI